MKSYLPLTLLITGLLLFGCTDTCETISSYTYYEPVYMSLEDLRQSVKMEAAKEITQSGKIYFINDHILINEPNNGIHIINNEDPKNPENLGFINIPGNFDLAAVDGYLYADSYVDLVVFDISDIANPKEIKRIEEIFPNYNTYGYYVSEEGIVTDWIETQETSQVSTECDGSDRMYYDWGYRWGGGIALDMAFAESSNTAGYASLSPGIGGSMAKFTISNNHLFMIDDWEMRIADLTTPSDPMLGSRVEIGWGIETVFPYDDMLFIGANNGMYIYDISSPLTPVQLSNYSHVNSCDPVVTDGKYAYVTLRSGNSCAGFNNQLEVVDIQDPTSPTLLATYPMYNPHGLSISDNKLFICDGEAGLKVYNANNVQSIGDHLIKNYSDIHAYDVIVSDCQIMLIGDDGLRQYHCNDFEGDIIYLSTIEFKKNI
ncbi:MAG: hypothetical protein CMP48_05815 [Rickettsiales bacterium]|nr:hypothetical protein [Rickettsiales bacterium]